MFKRLLSVGGFTLLSRITGFFRDVLMAGMLGRGALSDAFLVAFRFPNYFRAIFGEGTLNPAFLPRYAALHAKGEREAAARFGDEVYTWQMLIQAVVLIGAMAAMPWLVRVLAPGFVGQPGQVELATTLSRITFPYLIMTVSSVQLSAMLNAVGKFAAAAAGRADRHREQDERRFALAQAPAQRDRLSRDPVEGQPHRFWPS